MQNDLESLRVAYKRQKRNNERWWMSTNQVLENVLLEQYKQEEARVHFHRRANRSEGLIVFAEMNEEPDD